MATVPPALSYCVVNTNGREDLLACLDAIERTHPAGIERELLVLDNASDDGSAEAVRERGGDIRLIALERRQGKAANDSRLLREARGRYCLLLNEDSELQPGATEALIAALDADPRAGAAGAQLLDSAGAPVPCAWRFPGVGTALAGALFLHRLLTVQSKGDETRSVDWAQSSALMVRREAAQQVGYLDPAFFVYYDECDFCKRLARGGPAHALRPLRPRDPPRPALHRPRRRPPPHRRIPPQPRPLHAQASREGSGFFGARVDRLGLCPAGCRRGRHAGTFAADHVGACAAGSVPQEG